MYQVLTLFLQLLCAHAALSIVIRSYKSLGIPFTKIQLAFHFEKIQIDIHRITFLIWRNFRYTNILIN